MSKGLIVVIILALIALVAFGQYIGVRNTLVTKNEAVKASWSQVDIALQRRADLIPNLVETVKGYATQEQTVFGDIAKARSQLLGASTPAEKIAANNQLDGLVVKVLALQEAYPQRAPRTASRLSASATTTHSRTTTRTCSNSRRVCSRVGPASRRTTHTSKPLRARGRFRR
jgi:LemA protein